MIESFKAVIVEDETIASRHLETLLTELNPGIKVVHKIDSVACAIAYFNSASPSQFDLIFMDINLGDGLCFEILEKTDIKTPIIFTTTYDQYAIEAFNYNSIGYLLKPLDSISLEKALVKFFSTNTRQENYTRKIEKLLTHYSQPNYKKRCLVTKGDKTFLMEIDQIMGFYSDGGYVWLLDQKGQSFLINKTLETLEEHLNPKDFFRINRKVIVSLKHIGYVEEYVNYRLKLEMNVPLELELIVSRKKTKAFKKWLTGLE